MKKKQPKLKPCPWCGRKADIGPSWNGLFSVHCNKLFCGFGPSRRKRLEAAIEWNKRAKP